ncbi:SLATT domain-containing protein [Shewanella decolorationis]|uniref:SLATT domain-containing protein n=1 Tax=Shewanella decolorationis TaxID=256839 RepID=A0A5B8QR75_9GAMM|nr:SLATT domain-containing protein [Shewanella decolorationis]QDZ89044.1 SLATT domain-containing protein [Shewanella decolorationis]
MDKSDLLKSIAQKGYDVGFGAKKHFATYDIIEKTPGFISFVSITVGIYALVIKSLSTELISASFIVLGIIGLYVTLSDHKKADYEQAGKALTRHFSDLKALYIEVKGAPDSAQLSEYQRRLTEIENKFYDDSISKQIMFSNWYAHYKFFWEHQIDWIDEQLNFCFIRDKIPLSLWLTILVIVIGLACSISDITTLICTVSES